MIKMIDNICRNIDNIRTNTNNIRRNIDTLIDILSISEVDTQAILVEPILSFAGFDVNNVFEVKRSKSGKQNFDLKVYKGGNLLIGIEVKRVGSDEFNICKEGGVVDKGIGKLNENGKENGKDGVGQLRRYTRDSESKPRVAILTNGVKWGVFKDVEAFIENPQKPLSPYFFISSSNFECFDIENMGDFKGLIKFLRELIF